MNESDGHEKSKLGVLALTALGVVFGDIGTSPLYAIRECFAHGIEATQPNVLGILSLIFWSLMLVVSLKYVLVVMRADNRGEGGEFALLALITSGKESNKSTSLSTLVLLALFGAALLYGDGVITPAISVLSAVEGIALEAPGLQRFVVPITVAILVGLFWVQRRGTASVGIVFGPIMIVWFSVLAILGARSILNHPEVLSALLPTHGVRFLIEHSGVGFLVLGSVFLVVTGGEALYADMGHFGPRPIRLVWFGFVLPALLLNYFGQGALLLTGAEEVMRSPFYYLAPDWLHYPLVGLATAATVIASQAMISGAFSMSNQAVQLGYSPRLAIDHTSAKEIGQIYVSSINFSLMIATVAAVIGFGSSGALAAAYGIAVSAAMLITTILIFSVARDKWGWSLLGAIIVTGTFIAIEGSFFAANMAKLHEGGWFPLVIGIIVFTLMTTWKKGREILSERLKGQMLPLTILLDDIGQKQTIRVAGTAVFMTSNPDGAPYVLLHHLKHNKVLHEQVVLLTISTLDVPRLPKEDQIEVTPLANGFFRVVAKYGFMEAANVPDILARCEPLGLEARPMETTYYLGRETILATKHPGMALWRERLFAFMSRNALRPTTFFHIPPNRVVELGVQVEM